MVYKKCLVLGANGFVGRSLVKDLIPYFEQVTTFSLDLSKEIQLEGVENIIADFFDNVMVKDKDAMIANNRMLLLVKTKHIFDKIAKFDKL